MATIYLIRHGQAGTRDHYDQLSALGQQQAQLLGAYFAQQHMQFDAIYTGELQRQQATAALVCESLQAKRLTVPSHVMAAHWNEFSLANVYQSLVPCLLRDVPAFAHDYALMQAELKQDPRAASGAAGRCDRAVVEAWISERYPTQVAERWSSFRDRVVSAMPGYLQQAETARIAVFTSATPIAIWVATVLAVTDEKLIGLLAMLQNSSVTTIRVRAGEPWLFNFNTTPHLLEAAQRTHR